MNKKIDDFILYEYVTSTVKLIKYLAKLRGIYLKYHDIDIIMNGIEDLIFDKLSYLSEIKHQNIRAKN